MGHARAILASPSAERQLEIYQRILKEGLSVRKVEALAQEDKDNKHVKERTEKTPNPYAKLEKELSTKSGLNIKILEGKVIIRFADENELNNIVNHLS